MAPVLECKLQMSMCVLCSAGGMDAPLLDVGSKTVQAQISAKTRLRERHSDGMRV